MDRSRTGRSGMDVWIMENEGLNSLTREELTGLQLRKLQGLLRREKARDGYYRHLPDHLESLEELATLPTTKPQDLALHGASMILGGASEAARIITDRTSGTEGRPKRIYYSQADLERTRGFFRVGLGELVPKGSKVLLGLSSSGPGGLIDLVSQAIRDLDALPLRMPAEPCFGDLAGLVEKEGPATFIGSPSLLLGLSRILPGSSLTKAVLSGDSLVGSVEAYLEKMAGIELFPHYGSREMALGGAFTCRLHGGMHLRENHVIAEVLDPSGRPLAAGEEGNLVITTIGMDLLPLLRYETGDLARVIPGPCPCGSVTLRLGGIRRRARCLDIASLDEELFALESLVDYRIARQGRGYAIQALTLEGLERKDLEARLEATLGPGNFELELRAWTPKDKPLYPAKRRVLP